MNAKISDENIRQEKVNKLKEKILTEIKERINSCKKNIQSNISDDNFEHYTKEVFALLNLREYIKSKYCFMDSEIKREEDNFVIYMVQDEDLDIWLQDDYPFVINFLIKAEECGYDIFQLLNDKYFGYRFTDIHDKIKYYYAQEEIKECMEQKEGRLEADYYGRKGEQT